MGKQINYWLGYHDFLKIAQVALDLSCVILKQEDRKVKIGNTLDFVTDDIWQYYFLPSELLNDLSDDLDVYDLNDLRRECKVIEAAYSCIYHEWKRPVIIRARLYVPTGYYDEQGEFIDRTELLTKIYNKLVRTVKKIAPYTEFTDIGQNCRSENYLQEYTRKEYITPECLRLKEDGNYKLEG